MLKRLLAKKLSHNDVSRLVNAELKRIKDNCQANRVYLFGSAARGEMTDQSDLDLLVVCPDETTLKNSKERYYKSRQGNVWPVDIVFVTEAEYAQRSKIGGVCWMCESEGRLIFQADHD
jgi:predicted nucleotidyltransferase